jgi:hypothetical protein
MLECTFMMKVEWKCKRCLKNGTGAISVQESKKEVRFMT